MVYEKEEVIEFKLNEARNLIIDLGVYMCQESVGKYLIQAKMSGMMSSI